VLWMSVFVGILMVQGNQSRKQKILVLVHHWCCQPDFRPDLFLSLAQRTKSISNGSCIDASTDAPRLETFNNVQCLEAAVHTPSEEGSNHITSAARLKSLEGAE
jgi:hypothetical protein